MTTRKTFTCFTQVIFGLGTILLSVSVAAESLRVLDQVTRGRVNDVAATHLADTNNNLGLELPNGLVVTAMSDGEGELRLMSWSVDDNGSLSHLDTYATSYETRQVNIARVTENRVVTVSADFDTMPISPYSVSNGRIRVSVWDINSSGRDIRLISSHQIDGYTPNIAGAQDYSRLSFGESFITTHRTAPDYSGRLVVSRWEIASNGTVRFAEENIYGSVDVFPDFGNGQDANGGGHPMAIGDSAGNLKIIPIGGDLYRGPSASAGQIDAVKITGYTRDQTFYTLTRSDSPLVDGDLKVIKWAQNDYSSTVRSPIERWRDATVPVEQSAFDFDILALATAPLYQGQIAMAIAGTGSENLTFEVWSGALQRTARTSIPGNHHEVQLVPLQYGSTNRFLSVSIDGQFGGDLHLSVLEHVR